MGYSGFDGPGGPRAVAAASTAVRILITSGPIDFNDVDERQNGTEPEVRDALDLDPRAQILMGDHRKRPTGRDTVRRPADPRTSRRRQPVAAR
jgi:hypothetical protein